MNKTKKANILIFTIILVNLALIMAIVVLNNTILLGNISTISSVESSLSQTIRSKASWAIKYSNYLNTNGGGFVDSISCPDSVTMSGSTLKNTGLITDLVYNSGNIYCSGIYSSTEFKIYFNTGFTDFISADYLGDNVVLNGAGDKVGASVFSDGDSTLIDFLGTSYQKSDSIDDNFDSDNYKVTSTGSTEFPNNYEDDDANARKIIYGYISSNDGYKNIFWNNSFMEDYIDGNINNTDTLNKTIKSSSGYLFLEVDKGSAIKVIVFDKVDYTQNNAMRVLNSFVNGAITGSGYIQDDLSLSATITGNEYSFDFTNYDYGIFAKNTGTGVLSYSLKGESLSGSGLYINPIDDSDMSIIKVFGSDIFINDEGLYIGKQQEIIGKK